MMRTAPSGSSILLGFVISKLPFGPARSLPSDPDGGFVTALQRTSGILPKTVATAVNVTNPTSAIDRTVDTKRRVREVDHIRCSRRTGSRTGHRWPARKFESPRRLAWVDFS